MTFAAHAERFLRLHNERISLAWHTGALARWPLKSKGSPEFPKLEKLLSKTPSQKRRAQTQDEMINIAKMITVAFGGTVADTATQQQQSG